MIFPFFKLYWILRQRQDAFFKEKFIFLVKKFMLFQFREYRPVCWLLEFFEVCSYYCAYKHCESINSVNIISCLANWRERVHSEKLAGRPGMHKRSPRGAFFHRNIRGAANDRNRILNGREPLYRVFSLPFTSVLRIGLVVYGTSS